MSGFFEAVFGKIFSRGVARELQGGLNFEAPLRATSNTDESRIDIGIDVDASNPDVVTNLPYIDARHYAIGDGTTNDKVEILEAIAAAIAASAATTRPVPVIGAGKIYGITGNMTLPASTYLRDIEFKQLTPAAGSVRTLTSSSGNNIRLERVTVDRNGDGTDGSLSTDAGVYISGGSGHYFDSIEVFGDDMGSGIVITGASDFDLVAPLVHDMNYSLGADPGDDRVQGIWLNDCTDFRVFKPKVKDLGGNFGGGATTRWSRGIVFGGCSDFILSKPQVWDVDQGVDLTGSVGNTRFEIVGGMVTDCYTWGFKFANSARDGTVTGAVATRCGQGGFVAQGPNEAALTVLTSDITFVGCTAYDTGSNGIWGASANVAGFRVQNGAFDVGSTRGIRFIGCRAIDRQGSPTMEYGFHNEVDASTDGRYNECDPSCISIGHTVAAFQGMNAPRCTVNRGSALSIPDNAWTSVDWDQSTDLGEMHNPASNNNQVKPRRDGHYRITAGVAFAANATGLRGVRLCDNGGVIPGTTVLVNATAAGETALNTSVSRTFLPTRSLTVEVFQTSGGALNLQTTSAGVVEQVS